MDAQTRLKQIGMPRRNNELWTFFPVAKIPNALNAEGDCDHHASLVAGSAFRSSQ